MTGFAKGWGDLTALGLGIAELELSALGVDSAGIAGDSEWNTCLPVAVRANLGAAKIRARLPKFG